MKIYLPFILLAFVFLGCTPKTITGVWEIVEIEKTGDVNIEKAEEYRVIYFYGIQRLLMAKGKTYDLKEDGTATTTIVDDLDVSNVYQLLYEMNPNKDKILFKAKSLTDKAFDVYEFSADLEWSGGDIMYWNLDGIIRYKLERKSLYSKS